MPNIGTTDLGFSPVENRIRKKSRKVSDLLDGKPDLNEKLPTCARFNPKKYIEV
jgi:hypothetical protein